MIMRRFPVLVALVAVVLSLPLAPVTLAQEATPAATFPAALGLPELRITITDTGFEAPAEVSAGPVLLTVTNASSNQDVTADADFVQLPAGTTIADVTAFFGPPLTTPATPAADGAEGAALDWLYQATWSGGPIVPAGQTVHAVVDLTPGDWFLVNDSIGATQQPVALRVTTGAATPATMEEPAADVAVQLQEYAFVGLEHGVAAGPHLWQLTNAGEEPHYMLLLGAPAGISMDQVMTLLQMPEEATPPPSIPYQETDFDFNQPGLALISPGQTAWLALDLAPGTYLALCFVPDDETGAPHALLGMAQIFTVGGEMGSPAA
jgi:hypothetical protein